MLYYYIFIAISLFCIFREERLTTRRQKSANLVLALMPFFFLTAFKANDIGSDTSLYLQMFQEYNADDFVRGDEERIEYGYVLLNQFLYLFSHDGQIVFITTALLSSVACYVFFLNNAKHSCLALYFFLTLGFFGFALSGTRQTISISLGMFAYPMIKQKKLLIFALLIGLAMLFHKSTFCFIPAYLVAHRSLKARQIIWMFLGALLLFFFDDTILISTADILKYNYGIEETGNGYFFFAFVLFVTVMVVRARNKILLLNSENESIININFLSLATWTIRLISRTAERVSLYYLPFTAVALEEFISSKKTNKTMWKLLFVLLAAFLFLRRTGIQEDLNNYQFFFNI